MPEKVVETKSLTKRYDQFTALHNLSISLEKGQILGFIGPNGAGKTTTIKILVGLSKPTSGSATICGIDCFHEAKKIKRMVGYMPDTFGSYDNMRVSEYLDFFGAAYGIRTKQRRIRIDEVLETTKATYMKDLYVESLSHGMKQRIGIARTLLHDPQVLILDEPANGLDPQARIEMRELLLGLADMGKTLIVTSHILPELSRICNQVAIITKGKLRAYGSLDQIMKAVSQTKTIEIQLTDPAEAQKAYDALPNVVDNLLEPSLSETESVVRFRSDANDNVLSDILGKLIKLDIRVAQFRELQTDLEDAFLSVTQDRKESNSKSSSDGGNPSPAVASTVASKEGTEG